MKQRHIATAVLSISLLMFAAGCKKKQPVTTPPPTPAPAPQPKAEKGPAAVINSFTAEPSTIIRGESSTLKWNISNASEVTIDNGVGRVAATGSRQVSPTSTTTYRQLRQRGDGQRAISNQHRRNC